MYILCCTLLWSLLLSESTSKIALYQCIAKFSGRSERFEISLNTGDTVKVVDKKDHGWWYVQDQHGRAGWAPASHFKAIIDNSEYKPEDIKIEDVIGRERGRERERERERERQRERDREREERQRERQRERDREREKQREKQGWKR